MRLTLPRHELIGQEIVDVEGVRLGKVMDTYPRDGGGEIDLLLVHVGRTFPRRKWLPLEGVQPIGEAGLSLKWPRAAIEEAPDAEDSRWGSAADLARAYWLLADD